MNIKSKITLSKNVFAQEIDEETIILDSETQEYFSINEIGKVIWSLIEEKKNLAEIKAEMLDMYEVPEEQIEKDLLNFIQGFLMIKI